MITIIPLVICNIFSNHKRTASEYSHGPDYNLNVRPVGGNIVRGSPPYHNLKLYQVLLSSAVIGQIATA